MNYPLFVRSISPYERERLQAGLHSHEASVLRHCQILLASARGERVSTIARFIGCDDDTVREVIHAFNERGLEAVQPESRRPHHIHAAFTPETAERLREILHGSPRAFGKTAREWTLQLAAEVSFELGLTEKRVSGETIRATLKRMHVDWNRAKHWFRAPSTESVPKK